MKSFILFIFFYFFVFGKLFANKSDSINILKYQINLDIVWLSQKKIYGNAILEITPTTNKPLHGIALDLQQLNIDEISINGNTISNWYYNDTLIKFDLPQVCLPHDTIYIKVSYHGQPKTDPSPGEWGGFFFSNDSAFAYNIGVGFASIPHSIGRFWFPCIDEFSERAKFEINLRVKSEMNTACTGVLTDIIDNNDGTKTYKWKLDEEIPSYLASIAIGKFVPIVGTFNGILGEIPTYLHVIAADTAKARGTFRNLNSILQVFENRFGPYRWPRVGYVGVPFNSGAMEHATNIAFPRFAINGNITYESLIAHELSHHWFGNLITCKKPQEMWINEGFARYAEAIYLEDLYGRNKYDGYIKSELADVLKIAHIEDGGYYALNNVPENVTYGITSYDKGCVVIHTLRNYLGDSLFFKTIAALLENYKFQSISSEQIRDFISNFTGINMTSFFDAWVFTPGFVHFSIDSFKIISNASSTDFLVDVFVRQKTSHKPIFAEDNILDITFVDENYNFYTDTIKFSGKLGKKTFVVPFAPKVAFVDFYEKVADAILSQHYYIKASGEADFPNTWFRLITQSITDSALVRVEHNFTTPDSFIVPLPGIIMHPSRYWKIDGIFPEGFVAKGKFNYTKQNNLDTDFLTNSPDSIVMLYRANPSHNWRIIPSRQIGGATTGFIITDSLYRGEYVFGIKNWNLWAKIHAPKNINYNDNFTVFPNPSNEFFNIIIPEKFSGKILICDIQGKIVDSILAKNGKTHYKWKPNNTNRAIYIVNFIQNGKLLSFQKILFK